MDNPALKNFLDSLHNPALRPVFERLVLLMDVRIELDWAGHIVQTMFNLLSPEQRERVLAELVAAGMTGEGVPRHRERRGVLERLDATLGWAPL